MKKYKMHVLSHTHWDREWYQPFQHYRMRLVYQMDQLLETLENDPSYKCFLLDGQTCCVEDYLDIRPENRSRLQFQLKAGRLLMGPWYVMPDEFLISGESIIRNLQLGYKICSDFGVDPMPIGYVSDVFGHISQLPQILRGFDINCVFLHRGAPSNENEKSELLWEGADNSRVMVIKAYRDTGYNDFLSIHLYNRGDKEYIKQYEKNKISYSNTTILFSLDGNDHTPAFNDVKKIIDECNDIFVDTECFHSSMTDFLNDLNGELGEESLTAMNLIHGELRTPPKTGEWNEIFYGTGSSRHDLKSLNDQCENLLSRYAEPLNAWASLYGGDDNTALLSKSWNYLLKNHPHDSIVGCSMDQVHRDMIYRFDQCRLIAQACTDEAVRTIARGIPVTNGKQSLTLFNLSTTAKTAGTFMLEVPAGKGVDYLAGGFRPVLVDSDGVEFDARVSRIEKSKRTPYFMNKIETNDTKYYQIDFDRCHGTDHVYVDALFNLPPMSYCTFTVELKPVTIKRALSISKINEIGEISENVIISGINVIENEFIRASANPDGTINLFDKTSQIEYKGIGYLDDCGDKGEGWSHFYPEHDKLIQSKDCAQNVKICVCDNNIKSQLEVSYSFYVPLSLNDDRSKRVDSLTPIHVRNIYSLLKGKKYLECHTEIDNSAIEHRMRVLCPTDIITDFAMADSAFDIVKRPVKLRETSKWREKEREDNPIKNFIYVSDAKRGFAILTKGICEGCVLNDSFNTAGITLFRSFIETLYGESTSDSKHLGTLHFEYAFALPSNEEELCDFVEDYKLPVISFTHMGLQNHKQSRAHLDFTFINIGKLELSAVILNNDQIEVRIFNPYDKDMLNDVSPNFIYSSATLIDLTGNPAGDVPLVIPKKKVLTIRYNNCRY